MNFSALPDEVKVNFINEVTSASNHKLPEQIIEKDWWVTQVLKAVFSLPYAEHLSFKGEYVIPADVTFIDDGAFAGNLGITRVTFVNSDVALGEDAFSGCDNIEAIIVPKGTKDLFTQKFEEAYIEQNVTACIREA